jgi:4'-phosphopantetheinyl transferase
MRVTAGHQVGLVPTTDRALSEAVHVWSAWVDEPGLVGDLHLLDDDEQARAERYRFDLDRRRFIARRVLLRTVLAGYLGVEPATVRYRTSPMGRPELAPPCGITFSTSHADGLAVVAVASERPVGVDVERIRPIPDALDLALHFFSHREYEHLLAATEVGRSDAFLRLWTRKEAYIKAVGAGMAMPLDGFDVLDAEDGRHPRLREANGGLSYAMTSLEAPPGYLGTVAASGSEVSLNQVTPTVLAR